MATLAVQLPAAVAGSTSRTGAWNMVKIALSKMRDLLRLIRTEEVPGYNWSDKRVADLLNTLQTPPLGLQDGFIAVRRGKNDAGRGLKKSEFQSSGFVQGNTEGKPAQELANSSGKPVLVLVMEQGKRSKGWDDQRFYGPTLYLPRGQFAFLFQ